MSSFTCHTLSLCCFFVQDAGATSTPLYASVLSMLGTGLAESGRFPEAMLAFGKARWNKVCCDAMFVPSTETITSHLGKKKNHLEKCLGRGNVSWQEGSLEMLKICLKYATALFLILLPCDHVWPRLREDVSRYWHVGFEWLGMVQFQSWEMRVASKEVLVWGCDLKIAWSCTTTWHTSELHRWYLYVFVVVALSSSPRTGTWSSSAIGDQICCVCSALL